MAAGIAREAQPNLVTDWLPKKKSKIITNTKIDFAVLNLKYFLLRL